MKKNLLPFLLLINLFFISEVLAYVPSLTSQLKSLYWPASNYGLTISYSPVNSSGISDTNISAIINNALDQWGNIAGSPINFNLQKDLNVNEVGKNEIFFSDDPTIFGAGVIGIALVSYKDSTGEILEADIAINDNIVFSSNKDNTLYLGNVITHELGHFLGLGHEPTLESTMFFQSERGQFELTASDKQSILQLYNSDNSLGAIEGKIVGGSGLLGLFGVHVLALTPSGKIAASQITNPEGKFIFKGLSPNENYYIYTKPLTFKSSLPEIYNEARSNFCVNGDNFRGSFFQTCMKSDEGFPVSIKTYSNTIKSVGNITVRCSFDVPKSYFSAKDNSIPFNIGFNKSNMSTAYTGYFTTKDLVDNKEDIIEFTIPSDAVASDMNDLELKINFRSQVFYSIYKADFYVFKNGIKVFGRTTTTSDLEVKDDFSLNLDKEIVVPVVMGDNIQIKIKPKDWFVYLQNEENTAPIKPSDRRNYATKDFFPGFLVSSFDYAGLGIGEASLFKNSMALKDPLNIYFLSLETRQSVTGERLGSRMFMASDNSQCADAPNAYLVKNPLAVSQSSPTKSTRGKINSDLPLACGSIGPNNSDNGPGGGMGQMFFGFALVVFLMRLRKNLSERYKSKI